eukprot:INCI595.2.p1 GENE.INCI595.2~~INCI595.2.p1  ORF type:complete len:503 (-),score=64.88 INCI595.2:218-1726(-)
MSAPWSALCAQVRRLSFVSLAFLSFLVGIAVVVALVDFWFLPVVVVDVCVPLVFLVLLSIPAFWERLVPSDQQPSLSTVQLAVSIDEMVFAYAIGFIPGAAIALSVEAFVGSLVTLLFYIDQQIFEHTSWWYRSVIGTSTGAGSSEIRFFPVAGAVLASLFKSVGYLAFLFVTSFVTTGLVEEAVRWTISLRLCHFKQHLDRDDNHSFRLGRDLKPLTQVQAQESNGGVSVASTRNSRRRRRSRKHQIRDPVGVPDHNGSSDGEHDADFSAPIKGSVDRQRALGDNSGSKHGAIIPLRREGGSAPEDLTTRADRGPNGKGSSSVRRTLSGVIAMVHFVSAYSVGFSTVENILYAVAQRMHSIGAGGGIAEIGAALSRSTCVTPLHCACALVSGLNIGLNIAARSAQCRSSDGANGGDDSRDSTDVGAVGFTAPSRRGRSSYLSFQAVLPAVLLHGLFNFAVVLINSLTSDTSLAGHSFLRHGGCVSCSTHACLVGGDVPSHF